jgi:type I restriction enzyme S subunit
MVDTKKTKPFFNTEIPIDWEVKFLGEIGNLKNGINKDKEDFGFGFPMVNLMDVFGISKVYKNNFQLGLVNANERDLKEYSLQKGDVLFIRSSVKPEGVGLTTVICDDLENTTYSGFIIRFRDNGYLDLEFKAHCFFEEGFRSRLLNKSTISANTNINQVALNSLQIPVPPFLEQKAIATLLSKWDEAISKNQALIQQKEERKKWLMQNLLTGRKRLEGFDEEWEDSFLGEKFSERNETRNFDLPLLSIGSSGIYPQSDSVKKDISNQDKTKYKRICTGDIGYNTMRMWQGRSALSTLEGIVSPAYTIVIPKKGTDSRFFAYLFQTPKVIDLFWRNSQGMVSDTLNCKFKDFALVKIKLPSSKNEQTAVAEILQAVDKELKLLKAKTEKLKEQKKGLMQVLLTGKKRLKID